MLNPNQLLSPKTLLTAGATSVGGPLAGIAANIAGDIIDEVMSADKITRTTEDKPGKIQTPDDEIVDSLKKSSSYLGQIWDKGIISREVPNPAGSKF